MCFATVNPAAHKITILAANSRAKEFNCSSCNPANQSKPLLPQIISIDTRGVWGKNGDGCRDNGESANLSRTRHAGHSSQTISTISKRGSADTLGNKSRVPRGFRIVSQETCVNETHHRPAKLAVRSHAMLSTTMEQRSLLIILVGCTIGVISVAARSSRTSRFRKGKELRRGSSNDIKPTAIATWDFGKIAVDAAAKLLEDGSSAVDATEAGGVQVGQRTSILGSTSFAPGLSALHNHSRKGRHVSLVTSREIKSRLKWTKLKVQIRYVCKSLRPRAR